MTTTLVPLLRECFLILKPRLLYPIQFGLYFGKIKETKHPTNLSAYICKRNLKHLLSYPSMYLCQCQSEPRQTQHYPLKVSRQIEFVIVTMLSLSLQRFPALLIISCHVSVSERRDLNNALNYFLNYFKINYRLTKGSFCRWNEHGVNK